MRLILFAFLFSYSVVPAQTLTGTITGSDNAPVSGARITLFNADTSWFWETRTDDTGQYQFENLPGGGPYLFFGVAKPGFAYFQNATTGILGTVVHDAALEAETEQGVWDVIMQSPEPLGGTDLGVLMPGATRGRAPCMSGRSLEGGGAGGRPDDDRTRASQWHSAWHPRLVA